MRKIYSKKIAFELRRLGFRIVGTEPNPNYPQYDVYLFEDTPEFAKAFDDLMKGR